MLSHLHISNYALIDRLDIDLSEGYTVITGETGAGKSILLGALGLLLGARADARVVKQGEPKCVVEAVFHLQGQDLSAFFEENELEWDADEVVIRRELTAAGKSRAFVNDSPVLLNVLKPLGAQLVDIHSQHQNQLLGSEEFLLQTLDLVADNRPQLDRYTQAYAHWQEVSESLRQLRRRAASNTDEQELLRYQLEQLDTFEPETGEQEALEEEQAMLAHAEDIKAGLYQATSALADDTHDTCQLLRQCQQALEGVAAHLPQVQELAERLESTRIELSDIQDELNVQQERVEFNPQRLEFVESRLATLYNLLKRHHVQSEDELPGIQDALRKELAAADNLDDDLRHLEKAEAEARSELSAAAEALTRTRSQAAAEASRQLTRDIAPLGMPHGQVLFQLTPRPDPAPDGQDALTLLFSANKSVAPQDVHEVASGGETARLMLTLKAFTARFRQLPTIIFDEIDTGVSGTMAERMGQVMQELAEHCQVLCITHLPQIAALGSSHFRVFKEEDDSGTHSRIAPLSSEERVQELAVMLSGAQITDAAVDNARALLGRSAAAE